MSDKRIGYIDNAKGMLIALVVLGHVIQMSRFDSTECGMWMLKFVSTFHMSAFFIVSGVLFNDEKWLNKSLLEFVKNRFSKTIIPYFFFEICATIVHHFMSFGDPDTLLTVFYKIFTVNGYAGADWFLIVYFIAEIGVWMCLKIEKKWLTVVVATLTLFIPQLYNKEYPNYLTIFVVRLCLALGLILLGCLLKTVLLQNKKYISIIASFIGILIPCYFNSSISIYGASTGNFVLFILGSISGTYFILGIGQIISSRLLAYIGKNTIIILGVHQIFEWVIAYWFGMFPTITFVLLCFIIVFSLSIFMIPILTRICPRLVGK